MKFTLKLYNQFKQKVNHIYQQLNLSKYEKTKGRKLAISNTDTIALCLYQHASSRLTKKSIWNDFKDTLKCSYKTLVVNMNRCLGIALVILNKILSLNQEYSHLIKHTDSTDIPVCLNKNARKHKTMNGLSAWGNSGKGSFYGLKLHLTSDLNRKILTIYFTPGNIDDRIGFKKMNKELKGIFVADAGYISKELEQEFFIENERLVLIRPRKNMKKIATMIQRKIYDTRMIIEINFRNLKMLYGLITSLPRSIDGYLSNYTYSILSYVLR